MERPIGCGFGAHLLKHQPDVEKGRDCCDPPNTRRTWRQWARRNDCCFAKNNCAGSILCAPYTGIKWIIVGLFTIPLFFLHFGFGISRFFAGGAFHMVCRTLCHNKNSIGLTVIYYVFGGVPLLINYLIAACEMLVIFFLLITAFSVTFCASVLNPLCAVEACIELLVISDNIYRDIFENLPVALEHPAKLVAPCSFGFAYKSGNEPAQPAQHDQLVETGQEMQQRLELERRLGRVDFLHGADVQPAAVAQPVPMVQPMAQPMSLAQVPIVQGFPQGLPVVGNAGPSYEPTQPDLYPPSYTSGECAGPSLCKA